MEKNGEIIHINFKEKVRRDPKMVKFLKESSRRITGEIKDDNHLLPPGPDCYSNENLTVHIKKTILYDNPKFIFNDYKKTSEHIFSCPRCHALYLKISMEIAKEFLR